jgi:hypothetical protein
MKLTIRCACGKEATFLSQGEEPLVFPSQEKRAHVGGAKTYANREYLYGAPEFCPVPGCPGYWRTEMGRRRHNSNAGHNGGGVVPPPVKADAPKPAAPLRKEMARPFPCIEPGCPQMFPNPGSVRMHAPLIRSTKTGKVVRMIRVS